MPNEGLRPSGAGCATGRLNPESGDGLSDTSGSPMETSWTSATKSSACSASTSISRFAMRSGHNPY